MKQVAANLLHGTLMLQTIYTEQIPIPTASPAEHDALVALVERVLAAKRAHPPAATAALEREINARVHRLYALTPAEIQLVEEVGK